MAPNVTVARGDEIEVSFALDFKTAVVGRRPDKERYAFVSLTMECEKKGKVALEPQWCVPHRIRVTQDDQSVVFRLTLFDSNNPDFIASGEEWAILAQYRSEDGQDPEPKYNIRVGGFTVK